MSTAIAVTMDLKSVYAQFRKEAQEVRKKIAALEAELKSVKLSNKSTNQETNAIYRYNCMVETISKWNLHFSGEPNENMNVFISKVEENCRLIGLCYNSLLPYLSLFFKGTASVWYQTHRSEWKTWLSFRQSAREWYGDNRMYQQSLYEELGARVQGPDELVRDYLIHATALISKQDPEFSIDKDSQLSMVYHNLRPEIKQRIRREEFDSVKKMLQLAISSEYSVHLEKKYRSIFDDDPVVKKDEAKPQNDVNVKSEPSSANAIQQKQEIAAAETKGEELILNGNTVQELDVLYSHMLPFIREKVRRDQFDSLQTLIEKILEVESNIELPEQLLALLNSMTNDANSKLELRAGKVDRKVANMTNDEKLDILYRHLVPHIKERVRRPEIDSFNKLFEMIFRVELEIELEKQSLRDFTRMIYAPANRVMVKRKAN